MEDAPVFPAIQETATASLAPISVPVPPHRLSPLKSNWMRILTPLVEQMGLQVRFAPRNKTVDLRVDPTGTGPKAANLTAESALQRGAEFVRAFMLGFDVADATVLLRLDDIYVDSFEVKDVKSLSGDHLSRAIGRVAGRGGKTKGTIEAASRTRIVLADAKIHVLGSHRNIRVAKDALVSLILGTTPGTVHNRLRTVSSRLAERSRF